MQRPSFDPWVGKIPWRRKWLPTPVCLPGESHGLRSLMGYNPWGHKESDTTEQAHKAQPASGGDPSWPVASPHRQVVNWVKRNGPNYTQAGKGHGFPFTCGKGPIHFRQDSAQVNSAAGGESNLGLKSGFCPILAGHAQASYLISHYLNLLIY